jgi:hypothetical protein
MIDNACNDYRLPLLAAMRFSLIIINRRSQITM